MRHTNVIALSLFALLLSASVSYASEEYYGTLESRPADTVGAWIVNGRNVDATDKTRLIEEHGPLDVGACVEVEYEENAVKKIKSEDKEKCNK